MIYSQSTIILLHSKYTYVKIHLMSEPKTPYTFYIDPAQLERLRKLSEQTGVPVSEMIRRGLNLYERQTQLVDARVVWTPDKPQS